MSIFSRLSLRDPRTLILADQSLMSASGFLANFLLAWKLQMETYGNYALIFLGMMLLMSLQQALFIQPAQVMLPRFREARQKQFIGASLFLAIPILLIVSFTFELVFGLIYSIDLLPGVLTFTCFVWLIADLFRKLVILIKPTISLVILDGLNATLFICSILIFNPSTLNQAMIILGMSSLVGLGFLQVLKPHFPSKKIVLFYLFKTLPTAGWMLLTATVQWSSSNFLLLAAGSWINASALGVLRLSQYVFGLLNIFLQAYESFAVPQVVKFGGSMIENMRFIARFSIPFLLPVTGLLIFMVAFFPTFFSIISETSSHESIHYWFAALYLLIIIGYPLRVYIRAAGFNSIYFTAHLISLVFMFLSASFFIQSFQISGVVMGMILSQGIMILIWSVFILLKKQSAWKLSTSH